MGEVKYIMENQKELFKELQDWYQQECDGNWEHQYGIKIDTLDNHGWYVAIDLVETSLENKNLANCEAKWSLVIAVVILSLNLFLTGIMTFFYYKQIDYADNDKNRWEKEFQDAGENKSSPWPYNKRIQRLGVFLLYLKVIAPALSTIFFITSLF